MKEAALVVPMGEVDINPGCKVPLELSRVTRDEELDDLVHKDSGASVEGEPSGHEEVDACNVAPPDTSEEGIGAKDVDSKDVALILDEDPDNSVMASLGCHHQGGALVIVGARGRDATS